MPNIIYLDTYYTDLSQTYLIAVVAMGIMLVVRLLAIKFEILKRISVHQTAYAIVFLKTVTDSMIMMDSGEEVLSSITLALIALLEILAKNKLAYLRITVLIATVIFSSVEFNKV